MTSVYRFSFTGLLAFASLVVCASLNAQLAVPVGGVTIDFDNTITGANNGPYNGTAPANPPGLGQLDSRAFSFAAGTVFRGSTTFGTNLGNNTDGVYGFTGGQAGSLGTGHELGFVPPNGNASTFAMFSLTTVNATGSAINQLTLQLDFNYFNQNGRGVTLNVTYTIGGVTTNLPGLTFTASNGLGTIAGTHITSGLVTLAAPVANAGQIVFNFTLSTTSNGAGAFRDEAAIDNISLTEMFVPEPGTYAAGALAVGVLGLAWRRRLRA